MEKSTAAKRDYFACPCLNVKIDTPVSTSSGQKGILEEDLIFPTGTESEISISLPLLTSRQISNIEFQPTITTLICLNCSTAVYTVQKPLLKSHNSSKTTLGFEQSPVNVSRSPLASKEVKSIASDSPSLSRKGKPAAAAAAAEDEEDVLRPDPTSGTLAILKGCLQGSQSLARVAALETYSNVFRLQIQQAKSETNSSMETAETASRDVATSSNIKRTKSPRRPLSVANTDASSSLSPSPARNRAKRMAFRTEEEEGDDLDTLHLLENLLPPMPSLLIVSETALPSALTQQVGNPLSPRRATTNLPSSSYFPNQTSSLASQQKLESQLEASGIAELRLQHDLARKEIHSLLKAKRKDLAELEQRIRFDAQRLLGRRSRSRSKDGMHGKSRLDASGQEEKQDGEEIGQEEVGDGSPLFERKRTLPILGSDMTRGSSHNSMLGDVSGPSASLESSSVAMPGRASISTASTSNIGSYLSASFAMRGRDLPQAPTSPSFTKPDLPSKEDEDEWYAQKRRLRERYPHADHSELPSAVNSDDEGNVQVKKSEQSDEDEERRGRKRRPSRVATAAATTAKDQRGREIGTTKPPEVAASAVSGLDYSRKSSEEEVGKLSTIKKGALKPNTSGDEARSKDKALAGGEKKVAFAEVPRIKTTPTPIPPKEILDEGADAVFEIDEEIEGEGNSMSSDASLDAHSVAIINEKEALQSTQIQDDATMMARQANKEEREETAQFIAPKGGIAQSLPFVGSFAAMASLSGMGRGRKSDGEGDYEVGEEDASFDPASLRLEDDKVFIDRNGGVSSTSGHSLLPSTRAGKRVLEDMNDTSVFGSRPRPSRKDSSDLGPDTLLKGFPQSTKQQSSTIGFRVAVGEAEAQLSGLLAPYAPSHRNLWASSSNAGSLRVNGKNAKKYKSSEEIVEEVGEEEEEEAEQGMAWQRRQRINSTPEVDNLARSVPIEVRGSPQIRRSSMAGIKTTTFKDSSSGFDLEPKTSLPYREKKYTPSLRKVTRYLTAPALSGALHSNLATISDSSEVDGSANETSLRAPTMTKELEASRTISLQPSVPASVIRGFSQGIEIPLETNAMPTSTQSTPGLSSKGTDVDPFVNVRGSRKSVILNRYIPPPPPSTYSLRLEPSEENRPKSINLEEVQVQHGLTTESAQEENDVEKYFEFMHTLERLKTNKRTGWFHHRVSRPESIADHMYRMALLSMLLPNEKLDIGRCVQLCLVHDIAEALVGDLTPLDGVSKEEKLRREKEALLYLVDDLLQSSPAALRLKQLWMEYEDRETLESKVVKDLDRFELCLQAVEYERRYNITDLQPFYEGSLGQITHPLIRQWAIQLAKEREQLWSQTPYKYQQDYMAINDNHNYSIDE